jgi:hypothetical protein
LRTLVLVIAECIQREFATKVKCNLLFYCELVDCKFHCFVVGGYVAQVCEVVNIQRVKNCCIGIRDQARRDHRRHTSYHYLPQITTSSLRRSGRPLSGCLGRCPPTIVWGRLPAALHENGPDRFLTRGVPGGNVEELLRGLWLVTVELVHQGLAVCARPERRDDVDVTDLGEFVTLSGETPDVIPQGFPLL